MNTLGFQGFPLAVSKSYVQPCSRKGRKTSHRFLISGHLDPSADLRRGATKERERYSGPALGTAIDMELASEAAYTFANVEKAKGLGATLRVKRGRIEPRTAIGDDDADLVWPQILRRNMHGAADRVLHRI